MSADNCSNRQNFNDADSIIGRYYDRLKNLDIKVLNQWVSENFCIHQNCQRNFGYNPFDSQSCPDCLEIGILTSLKNGPPKTMKIETGKYKNSEFFFFTQLNPYFEIKKVSPESLKISELSKISKNCGIVNDKNPEIYFSVDYWLNEILINQIFQKISKIRLCVPIVYSYVCGNIGIQITDRKKENLIYSNSQEIFTEEKCLKILSQLSLILFVLKKYQFIHGAATINNICVDWSKKTKIKYQKKVHNFDFKLYLSGLHLSSITHNGVRIFPSVTARGVNFENDFNNFELATQNSIKVIRIPEEKVEVCDLGLGCSNNMITLFETCSTDTVLFSIIRYSGYPLFGGSIDVYSFFISLLSWRPFGKTFETSPKLQSIWTKLFYNPLDVPTIKYDDKPIICSMMISKILINRLLYCDAIERFFDLCS